MQKLLLCKELGACAWLVDLIVRNRNGAAHELTVKSRWSLALALGGFGRGSFASVRRRDLLFMALAGGCRAIRSEAQGAWPVRVSRIIVPFAPAGALDTPARMLARRLSGALGANFIVENRSGAGDAIGAQMVVQALPDGGTLLFTSSSVAIFPAFQPNLGFDPTEASLVARTW
jgi:hypothetical protein